MKTQVLDSEPMSQIASRVGLGYGLGLGLVGRVLVVVVGSKFEDFGWVRTIESGDRVTGG